jgi:predicted nuclease with TOPRIM domain
MTNHYGLITTSTNYQDITNIETKLQQLQIEMIKQITEIDNHLFALDGHVMRIESEAALLREAVFNLQTKMSDLTHLRNVIHGTAVIYIVLALIYHWAM